MAEALLKWSEKVRFTTCIYQQGLLQVDYQDPIESMNDGFMYYMKKHLNNEERYREQLLSLIHELDTRHKDLHKKIRHLMLFEEPMGTSFQKIITSMIRYTIPTLKRSRYVNARENNIYGDVAIFKLIFEKVSTIDSIKESDLIISAYDNTHLLSFRGLYGLGQGEFSDMSKLKTIIEYLVSDASVGKKNEEYTELYQKIMNDRPVNELKSRIKVLHTYIQGGGYLGGLNEREKRLGLDGLRLGLIAYIAFYKVQWQ